MKFKIKEYQWFHFEIRPVYKWTRTDYFEDDVVRPLFCIVYWYMILLDNIKNDKTLLSLFLSLLGILGFFIAFIYDVFFFIFKILWSVKIK